MRNRRPPYTRLERPPSLRLTERDRRILETIHAFDGLMSLRQIDRLFFSGRGGTWARERMRALFDHGYVNMPDTANVYRVPLGETIYLLGKKGAALGTITCNKCQINTNTIAEVAVSPIKCE